MEQEHNETLEQAIIHELESLSDEDLGNYLNNLHTYLIPQKYEGFGLRAQAKQHGWDTKFADTNLFSDYEVKDSLHSYSDFRLKKTYREFFQDIDKALEKSPNAEEIKQLLETYISCVEKLNQGERDKLQLLRETTTKLRRKLIPVFAKLRQMGYDKEDLTT